MIINLIVIAAVIWIALTVFEPFWVALSAKREQDRKYAKDRLDRAAMYDKLREMHEASPLYRQYKSAQQKNQYSRRNAQRPADYGKIRQNHR